MLGMGSLRLVGLSLVLSITGCVGSTQLYPGPRRPEADVSVFFEDKASEFGTSVTVTFVDGHEAAKGSLKKVIAVLPGPHDVTAFLDYQSGNTWYVAKTPQTVRINTEPGHYYACTASVDENAKKWQLKVVDVTERRAGGGLKGVQAAAGY
jgi:hypothetical protein